MHVHVHVHIHTHVCVCVTHVIMLNQNLRYISSLAKLEKDGNNAGI